MLLKGLLPVFVINSLCADLVLIAGFEHNAMLDLQENIQLLWDVEDDTITFEVRANTTGYIGIGLSTNGGMKGADIMLGWVKENKPYISDRHGVGNVEPEIDVQSDYELLYGSETDGLTVLGYRRKLVTCDPDDMDITTDTVRVIWSYNPEDPEGTTAVYHGPDRRGVKSVIFIGGTASSADLKVMPENTQSMDLLAEEVIVPGDRDTTYWCSHIELPVLQERQHVIRIDPIIQKGNEGVVHHFILKECQSGLHNVIKNNMSLDCENEIMFEFNNCKKLVYGWAIGGGPLEFPDHVGYSIGGPGSPRYLQLEVHYDNPQLIEGIRDVAGIRFYYTPDIRPFEADMMEVGITTFSPWIIPPGVTDFKAYGVCNSICSNAMFADGDIKIFSVLLHAHLAGTAIRLSHYRDGKFIGDIVRDNLYDFNLQEQRILKEDWIVKPGDELLVECNYNTATRDKVTFSGLSTKDEMCVAFLLYYPRVNALECGSAPDPMTLAEFLNVDILPTDSFHEVIYGLDWTKERKIASEDWYKKSNHMMTCTNSSEYPFVGEYIPNGPPPSMEIESMGYLVEELNSQVDETKCRSSAVRQLSTWYTVTLLMIITSYVFL